MDLLRVRLLEHVAELLEPPARCCDITLETVLELLRLALLDVALRLLAGFVDEARDLLLGEPAGRGDLDTLGGCRHVAAATLTMPFESIANETSICGTPRGDGGMPTSSNLPSDLFSPAICRSPEDVHLDRVLVVPTPW